MSVPASYSSFKAAAAIVLLCVIVSLPGFFTLPPIDRDEPRFTQATKQMVASQNYVDIRFSDKPRYKKPAGIHWVQSVSVWISGYNTEAPIWVYRIPSLMGLIICCLLLWRIASVFFERRFVFASVALFPLLLLSNVEVRLAKTDMVLLACILLTILPLARSWFTKNKPWDAFLFWSGLGACILIKGPIGPLLILLMTSSLSLWGRQVSWLKPLMNPIAILLAILFTMPWFVAIGFESNGEFYRLALGEDLFSKVKRAREGHGAPPGFYTALVFVTFWPVSAYLTGSVMQLKKLWQHSAFPFLLAWFLPFWILVELVPTKLPHYPYPVYPALLLFVVSCVLSAPINSSTKPTGFWRKSAHLFELATRLLLMSVPFSIGVGIVVVTYLLEGVIAWIPIFFSLMAMFAGAAALYSWQDKPRSLFFAGLSASGLFFGFFQFGAPALSRLWIAPRLVAQIQGHTECSQPLIFVHGYNEPSFVFLNNRPVYTLVEYRKKKTIDADCHFFVIEERRAKDFPKLVATEDRGSIVANLEGFNLSTGRSLNFAVHRLELSQK